jgi:hypothetical protein
MSDTGHFASSLLQPTVAVGTTITDRPRTDPPAGHTRWARALVTPGLFGTMQVKWLARLRFETAESPNLFHATEYRVPLSLLKPEEKFRFTLENSRPTWDILLMSYILEPEPGTKLQVAPSQSAASHTTMARHAGSPCWCRSTAATAGSRRSFKCPTVPMPRIGGRHRLTSSLVSMRFGRDPSALLAQRWKRPTRRTNRQKKVRNSPRKISR